MHVDSIVVSLAFKYMRLLGFEKAQREREGERGKEREGGTEST